jgi:hypothetical protein
MDKAWFGRLVGFAGAACVAMVTMACEIERPEDAEQQQPSATDPAPHSVGATVGVSGNTINAAVQGGNPDETVTFPADVSVTLNGPPGTPAVNLTSLFKVDGESAVHLEPFQVTEPGKYEIVLAASDGAMVLGNKTTGATLKIGTVRLGFERLANGTMLVPTAAKLTLPTSGSTAGNGATFHGLPSGTKVTAALQTQTGTVLTKSAKVPQGASSITITDVGSGIDVSLVDGDNSVLSVATSAE